MSSAAVPSPADIDLALVGGGLQNALIALAALAARPELRVAMFERDRELGGNHTWCFHDGDAPLDAQPWLDPLVVHRWTGYDVEFPHFRRTLASSYACITAPRLHDVVRAAFDRAPGAILYTGAEVSKVEPGKVTVGIRGEEMTFRAQTVVDARGPGRLAAAGGWQKFVGHEIVLAAPHQMRHPMLMDASVPQLDGFRFFYVLPLAPNRLLIEDTRFSEDPELDVVEIRTQIDAYRSAHGWLGEIVREEIGTLPLPWRASVTMPEPGLVTAGYMGGWFHPVTGYSFPVALRLARTIADALLADQDPAAAVTALAARHRKQLGFGLRLNWMMFRWFAPKDRYGVLEHFYRLPENTVRRFYALELTRTDRLRMFLRRPPRGLSWRAMRSAGFTSALPPGGLQ